MKYFTRIWSEDPFEDPKVMLEYEKYYKTIEGQIPNNIRKIFRYRHDTHISKVYLKDNDYIMEITPEIWGSAKFVFKNATIRANGYIEDEYWLYDEIYKKEDKYEIHILFTEADIIINCDDVQIEVEEKEYFANLYEKSENKFPNSIIDNEIVTTVINKEFIVGTLTSWEQVIFSFSQIYYVSNVNIEDTMLYKYHVFEKNEEEEIYKIAFENFEKDLKEYIETINTYIDIIKDNELKYVIEKLLEVYTQKDIPMKEKNQMYLKINEKLLTNIDFSKIYMRILDCINEGLIK